MSSAESPQDDDLTSFANLHIPKHEGPDFAGKWAEPYARSLEKSGLDGASVPTQLAVVFWQIVMETEAYEKIRHSLELPPSPWYERDELIVAHGNPTKPQFNLIVLDDGFMHDPRAKPLHPSQDDLKLAFERWKVSRLENLKALDQGHRISKEASFLFRALIDAIDVRFATKATANRLIYVLAARRPDRIYTAIPMAPWPISSTRNPAAQASAGAVVRHKQNTKQIGVTIAAHAIPSNSLRNLAKSKVLVNGQSGTIVSCDIISDSCFVELSSIGPPQHSVSTINGVLHSIPAIGTRGQFDGCGSRGVVPAMIQAVNVNVAIQLPLVQQTFNLSHTTKPGDSGCAFLDSNGVLIGFAFASTKGPLLPQYSTWIWVDPVFAYHKLQAF